MGVFTKNEPKKDVIDLSPMNSIETKLDSLGKQQEEVLNILNQKLDFCIEGLQFIAKQFEDIKSTPKKEWGK
jgi:hypothetical protein